VEKISGAVEKISRPVEEFSHDRQLEKWPVSKYKYQ
jgi:hypothetical protein